LKHIVFAGHGSSPSLHVGEVSHVANRSKLLSAQ